jgi:hypothetical protein
MMPAPLRPLSFAEMPPLLAFHVSSLAGADNTFRVRGFHFFFFTERFHIEEH